MAGPMLRVSGGRSAPKRRVQFHRWISKDGALDGTLVLGGPRRHTFLGAARGWLVFSAGRRCAEQEVLSIEAQLHCEGFGVGDDVLGARNIRFAFPMSTETTAESE